MGDIQGLNNLFRKVDRLGGSSRKALKRGIVKGTKLVQGDAKDLCAVDRGDLRDSIRDEVEEIGDVISGKVATNKENAPYIEFGTGQKGEESDIEAKNNIELHYREDWSGMAPQPYLYPALKQNEERVTGIVIKELKDEIRKLVR